MTNAAPEPGRPLVFRGGTVLTMNDQHELVEEADVLVIDQSIAGVGKNLEAGEGAVPAPSGDDARVAELRREPLPADFDNRGGE